MYSVVFKWELNMKSEISAVEEYGVKAVMTEVKPPMEEGIAGYIYRKTSGQIIITGDDEPIVEIDYSLIGGVIQEDGMSVLLTALHDQDLVEDIKSIVVGLNTHDSFDAEEAMEVLLCLVAA